MNKLKTWISKPRVWGFILSTVIMAIVSVAFFYPDNFEGNSLRQADMQQGMANGQEAKAYYEATGEKALWTNALFGGMPTFQISPSYPSNSLFEWLNEVYGLGLPSPSNLLFMMMMGFFILLYVMKFRWYYALIGAMAWGFSSYFIIIIGAGHIWKFVALTYVPPTIAGLVLSYRGRYVAGAAMTALFAMLQLNANHPQMSYYFAMVMFALVVAWLAEAIRAGKMRRWCIASAVTVVAGGLAIGANLPSIYNTYEYAKETKRAQSELTPLEPASGASSAARPTGGMPYDQIVGWSYGQSESFSLLIPNIKGGATARPEQGGMVHLGLDRLPEAAEYENSPVASMLPYMTQYFNDSEGTNGPVYVGAIICALFLLGCFIVRGPVKWALLVMTVISVVLAWGANFQSVTDLFIYNFPMYNKFRAVESILVIAEFTMPLLAIMALKELLTTPDSLKLYAKPLYISFGICALLALAAAVAPGMFGDAITSTDRLYAEQIAQQVAAQGQQYGYQPAQIQQLVYEYSLSNPANVEAIENLRYGMVRSDAWRSLIFIVLAFAMVYCAMRSWLKQAWSIAAVGVLILIDLYGADKRYVAHDSFVAVAAADTYGFTPDAVDNLILQDTANYRVMDIPGFWRADRSYFHHTIGGYHAAKLNRYEDLIQRMLNPAIQIGYMPELRDDSIRARYEGEERVMADRLAAAYRTLDMLNARYIITGQQDAPVLVNTRALGNAWLVDNISYVDGADAEMAAMASLDPAREAVADKRFAQTLGSEFASLAPGDTIMLTSYTPNRLTYSVSAASDAVGVFSEVWFPWGWKATIDGQPAQLGRVNYLLRALHIPAGKHEIEMVFDPDSIHTTSGVAYASVSIIYLLVLLALFLNFYRKEEQA